MHRRAWVSLFNQCYWIVGSMLGALICFDTAGIDFSMTALFVTVFVEQWLTNKNHLPAIAGLACLLVCGTVCYMVLVQVVF